MLLPGGFQSAKYGCTPRILYFFALSAFTGTPTVLGPCRCFWYFASPSGHLSAPVVAQRSRRHYVPASDVAALLISLFAQAAKACSLMANVFAQSSAPFCSLGGLLPRGARFRAPTRWRYAQFGLLVLSDSCSSYGYFYERQGAYLCNRREPLVSGRVTPKALRKANWG